MAKYRNILLDMQQTTDRIDAFGLPSADILPEMYDSREDGEEESFFSEEFEAPNDAVAVKISRGIFWDNNFTKDDTCTTVQRWDGSAWVEIGNGKKTNMELCDQCGEECEKADIDGGRCLKCGTMIVADKNPNIMWISKEKAREMILEAYALVRDGSAELFLHIDCDNDLEVIEVGVEDSEYNLIFPNDKVKYDSENGFLYLNEEANRELVVYQVLRIVDLDGRAL